MNARIAAYVVILLGLLTAGCGDDNGTPPIDTIRFGQLGEVEVGIVAPLVEESGSGELQQILTWGSSGAWVLREVISYRGLEGDETIIRSTGDPVAYASAYASLITQLNDKESVELFSISPEPPIPCAPTKARVTVTIWDELRKEEASWVRCASGSLGTLKTSEAGPDLDALKVIQAAILVRDFTQGSEFVSTYVGSVPFGTLDRGEVSGAGLEKSKVFFSVPEGNPNPPTNWLSFWADHNKTLPAGIPFVDWSEEMVVVAAVGTRTEAGDSVEVRRILRIGNGTTEVFLHERIPGDFCSPAARTSHPFHIVVAPRTPQPTSFADLVQERVPCGE